MDATGLKFLAGAIAMLSGFGTAIALGNIFSAWLSGIARNPAAAKQMNTPGFIGFAAAEVVLFVSFGVSYLILFMAK